MPAAVWAWGPGELPLGGAGDAGPLPASAGGLGGARTALAVGDAGPVPGLPVCYPVHLLPLTHTLHLQQALRVSPGGSQPGRALGSPVSS